MGTACHAPTTSRQLSHLVRTDGCHLRCVLSPLSPDVVAAQLVRIAECFHDFSAGHPAPTDPGQGGAASTDDLAGVDSTIVHPEVGDQLRLQSSSWPSTRQLSLVPLARVLPCGAGAAHASEGDVGGAGAIPDAECGQLLVGAEGECAAGAARQALGVRGRPLRARRAGGLRQPGSCRTLTGLACPSPYVAESSA